MAQEVQIKRESPEEYKARTRRSLSFQQRIEACKLRYNSINLQSRHTVLVPALLLASSFLFLETFKGNYFTILNFYSNPFSVLPTLGSDMLAGIKFMGGIASGVWTFRTFGKLFQKQHPTGRRTPLPG